MDGAAEGAGVVAGPVKPDPDADDRCAETTAPSLSTGAGGCLWRDRGFRRRRAAADCAAGFHQQDGGDCRDDADVPHRSEEHTSELQSLMRISYAVLCLKKK